MARARLIIPSFKDSERLAVFLPELCHAIAGIPEASIQVVDDGSEAEELEKTRAVVGRMGYPQVLLEVLSLDPNVGKGGAVYAGWDAAPDDVDWLGFVDADGATPASEVARLLQMAFLKSSEVDVLIGSRVQMIGYLVERKVKRHLVGRLFATISSLLTGLVVYDSQCGCKFLKASFYRKVRPMLFEKRFAFDIDLLANLSRAGAVIRECPVDWCDVPGSKVSVVRDGVQMLFAVIRLRHRLSRWKAMAIK